MDMLDLSPIEMTLPYPVGHIEVFEPKHAGDDSEDKDISNKNEENGVSTIVDRLWSTYKSETFTDLVIRCNIETFLAHRIILATHSKVFGAMIAGNFKEGKKKSQPSTEISLPDDDPEILEMVIEFMYRNEISFTTNGALERIKTAGKAAVLAEVFALGDKYDVEGLCDYIVDQYSKQFDNTAESSKPAIKGTVDSYIEFFESIEPIYTLTPESNRALRDAALSIIYDHGDYIKEFERSSEALKDVRKRVFRECPEFLCEFVEECWEGFSGSICLDCGQKEGKRADPVECMKCPKRIWYCHV